MRTWHGLLVNIPMVSMLAACVYPDNQLVRKQIREEH